MLRSSWLWFFDVNALQHQFPTAFDDDVIAAALGTLEHEVVDLLAYMACATMANSFGFFNLNFRILDASAGR